MTKEKLLAKEHIVHAANGDSSYIPLMALNEFFESNVCIPIGTNRHPHADVLHEWIEGSVVERVAIDDECSDLISVKELFNGRLYRIKPTEPIYEYQWILNNIVSDLKFYTEDEAKQWSCKSIIKIEETKRIRK